MNSSEFQRKVYLNIIPLFLIITIFMGSFLINYVVKVTPSDFQIIVWLFIIVGGINFIVNLAFSAFFLRPIVKVLKEIEEGKTFDEKTMLKFYDKALSYPYTVAIFGALSTSIAYLIGIVFFVFTSVITFDAFIKSLLMGISVAGFYGLIIYFLINSLVLKISPSFTRTIPFASVKKLTLFYKIFLLIAVLLTLIVIVAGVIIHASMLNVVESSVEHISEEHLSHLITYDLQDLNAAELNQNNELLANHVVGSKGVIFAIDSFGNVLASSSEERPQLDPAVIQQILKNRNIKYFDDLRKQIIVSRYSEAHDAIFISVADSEEFAGIITRTLIFFSFVFFIVYFIAFVSALYFASSISEPIKDFHYLAESLSKGGEGIKYVLTRTGDEFGELASMFNSMASELNKHRNKLENTIAEKTGELSTKIKESEDSKKAILNIMDDVEKTNKSLFEVQLQLKKNLEELKLLDKKKNEFVSITAHELKTPITSIRGFVELLIDKFETLDSETRNKYFDIIRIDTTRLNKLISDILDLSKIDLKALKLDLYKVVISDLFKQLEDELGIIVRKKGLEFIFETGENVPKSTVSDKNRLLQILSNLVNNALHYTEKGSITVKVVLNDNFLLFSVTDTGVGIEPQFVDKLFQRFYQVDSSYTRKIGGSGLGLAISKELVGLLGGRIWLESKVNEGTTFFFTIPIK